MAATGIKRTSRRANLIMEPQENVISKSVAKDVLVLQVPRKAALRKSAE